MFERGRSSSGLTHAAGPRHQDFRDVDAWSAAQQAAFWFASAYATPEFARHPRHGIPLSSAGTVMQHYLTYGLFHLDDRGRKAVLEAFDRTTIELEWRRGYAGAMAVVRAAHGLAREDVTIFLPSRSTDEVHKTDLLVRLPDGRFMCVQVKSRREDLIGTRAHPLGAQSLQFLKEEAAITYRAMKAFGKRYNVRCVPVLIEIGKDGAKPWEVQLQHLLPIFNPLYRL